MHHFKETTQDSTDHGGRQQQHDQMNAFGFADVGPRFQQNETQTQGQHDERKQMNLPQPPFVRGQMLVALVFHGHVVIDRGYFVVVHFQGTIGHKRVPVMGANVMIERFRYLGGTLNGGQQLFVDEGLPQIDEFGRVQINENGLSGQFDLVHTRELGLGFFPFLVAVKINA